MARDAITSVIYAAERVGSLTHEMNTQVRDQIAKLIDVPPEAINRIDYCDNGRIIVTHDVIKAGPWRVQFGNKTILESTT